MAASVAAGFGEVLMPLTKAVVGFGGWLDARMLLVSLVTFVGALITAFPLLVVSRWTLREKVLLGN